MDTSTPLILKSMSPGQDVVAVRLIKEWHASLQTQRGWRASCDAPIVLLLCYFVPVSRVSSTVSQLARWSWWRWLGHSFGRWRGLCETVNEQTLAAQLGKPARGSSNHHCRRCVFPG